MMAKKIIQQLPTLRKLYRCNKQIRKALLKSGGKKLQLCLRECAVNVLKGNVHLSQSQFKKLGKHKKKLRELSKKSTSQKKRLRIVQSGGFLPLLLAPIIGSLVGDTLKKLSR